MVIQKYKKKYKEIQKSKISNWYPKGMTNDDPASGDKKLRVTKIADYISWFWDEKKKKYLGDIKKKENEIGTPKGSPKGWSRFGG